MCRRLRSFLWDNRNEPLFVVVASALLVFVLLIFVFQLAYRKAPLYCPGIILPVSNSDCPKPIPPTDVPIGTIVAYFGRDRDIPKGWVLCDGQNIPKGSPINIDANNKTIGFQVPDLTHKFIRGSQHSLDRDNVQNGGSDTISLKHTHLWAHFKSNHWFSYDESDTFTRVDNWNNGIGNAGKGNYPLLVRSNTRLFTQEEGSERVSTLPSFVELRFIMKVLSVE